MLIYLAIIYVVFRIVHFLIVHKTQDRKILGKMIMFLILEVVLVVAGIVTIVPVIFGGTGMSTAFAYTLLIVGVACLIASGRIGVHIRKLAKGVSAEAPSINPISKKQLNLAKIFTFVSFLAVMFAWPFYQALFKTWAALIYAISLVSAIIAIRYANKSRSDQGTKKGTA